MYFYDSQFQEWQYETVYSLRFSSFFLSFFWLISTKLWNSFKKSGNAIQNNGIFIVNTWHSLTLLQNGTKYYSISRFRLNFSLLFNDVIFESSDTLECYGVIFKIILSVTCWFLHLYIISWNLRSRNSWYFLLIIKYLGNVQTIWDHAISDVCWTDKCIGFLMFFDLSWELIRFECQKCKFILSLSATYLKFQRNLSFLIIPH